MIVFYKDNPSVPVPLDTDRLWTAYNKTIVRFYSDTLESPDYCDITLTPGTNGITIRLYPNPQGYFMFDFMPYITAIINSRQFVDDTFVSLIPGNYITYVRSLNSYYGRFMPFAIKKGVSTDSATYLFQWLMGVMQVNDFTVLDATKVYVLSPFKKDTANHYFLKYWAGYPFDIPMYNSNSSFYIKNETNLIEQEFPVVGTTCRFFLSDGRTDTTIDDVLGIVEGYNRLRLKVAEEDSDDDKFINILKVGATCGVYLKWHNVMGGYSYWLFEDVYSIDRSTKQIGELEHDYNNIEDTYTRTLQIGKESTDSIRIIAELLTEDERRIVEGIIDSPKIYLFTGQPYSQAELTDWMEVTLKTTNTKIKNPKQPLTNFTFDIELPKRYTQTL